MDKKKQLLAIAVLTVVVIVFTVYYYDQFERRLSDYAWYRSNYLSREGYAKVLGVENLNYYKLIAAYGEPDTMAWIDRFSFEHTRLKSEWEGFSLVSVRDERKAPDGNEERGFQMMISLSVEDPALRFGRQKIGLNSTREEIERAYSGDLPVYGDSEMKRTRDVIADAGYYADSWATVLFCFDENDRVTRMFYVLPAV